MIARTLDGGRAWFRIKDVDRVIEYPPPVAHRLTGSLDPLVEVFLTNGKSMVLAAPYEELFAALDNEGTVG